MLTALSSFAGGLWLCPDERAPSTPAVQQNSWRDVNRLDRLPRLITPIECPFLRFLRDWILGCQIFWYSFLCSRTVTGFPDPFPSGVSSHRRTFSALR